MEPKINRANLRTHHYTSGSPLGKNPSPTTIIHPKLDLAHAQKTLCAAHNPREKGTKLDKTFHYTHHSQTQHKSTVTSIRAYKKLLKTTYKFGSKAMCINQPTTKMGPSKNLK